MHVQHRRAGRATLYAVNAPAPVPQPVAPFDAGNSLLSEQSAVLVASLVDTGAGQRLALTIRTATTTLTVLLQGPDAKTWAAQLTQAAAAMSSAGLVAAVPLMPAAAGTGL